MPFSFYLQIDKFFINNQRGIHFMIIIDLIDYVDFLVNFN